MPAETVAQTAFRKIMWRLMPLLTIAYILNYLDRGNIGFAALQMNKELGLTAAQFGFGAGILSLGYCVFEIPSNLALYRFGARVWIARIMISWGLVAAGCALISGPASFYSIRFLLGSDRGRASSPASPFCCRNGSPPNIAPACSPSSCSASPSPRSSAAPYQAPCSGLTKSADSQAGNGCSSSKACPASSWGLWFCD